MAEESEVREAAIERIKNRRGFVPHVICYVTVNALLVGIWAVTGAGYFWPVWVIAAWGVGIVMHAYTAFVQKPITEQDVDREIERGGSAVA